jgi:hypothetical protein
MDYFSLVMKLNLSVKETERALARELRDVLAVVPMVELRSLDIEGLGDAPRVDIIAEVAIASRAFKVLMEVKSSGQPRAIRSAVEQALHAAEAIGMKSIVLVGAPYMADAARRLCDEAGVGWLDLAGNVRIVGPGLYIDRQTAEKPKAVARELKSPFAPKSARILRCLLETPGRAWKVTDLADAAKVSLGQVSNVRRALIEREWASADSEGLQLTDREGLLRGWRESYEPPVGERRRYYTTLHGKRLEVALRDALRDAQPAGRAAAMSFTAADWWAPYARVPMIYLIAEPDALPALVDGLQLKPVESGANVEILIPDEADLLDDLRQPAPGLWTTSPLQTFLDLGAGGERGQEAADHLLASVSQW